MLSLTFLQAGLFFLSFVSAANQVKTIDDNGGDSTTQITFFPSSGAAAWQLGSQCRECLLKPTKAFGGTWHDVTHRPGTGDPTPQLTVDFEGTGISVFCILANRLGSETLASYSFSIDGTQAGAPFVRQPADKQEFDYDVQVFEVNNLAYGKHKLVMSPFDAVDADSAVGILFDYVTINYVEPDPPTVSGERSETITKSTTSATSNTQTTLLDPDSTLQIPTSPSSSSASESLFGHSTTHPDQTAPSQTSTDAPSPQASGNGEADKRSTPIGAIAGGVVSGLAILAFVTYFLVRRRRRHLKRASSDEFRSGVLHKSIEDGTLSPPETPPNSYPSLVSTSNPTSRAGITARTDHPIITPLTCQSQTAFSPDSKHAYNNSFHGQESGSEFAIPRTGALPQLITPFRPPPPTTTDVHAEAELLRRQVGILQAEIVQMRGSSLEGLESPPPY